MAFDLTVSGRIVTGGVDVSVWQEIVTAALVGTERAPFAPPSATGALGEALAGLGGHDPESALLASAALTAEYDRAGLTAVPSADPLPALAPVDPFPPVPDRVARRLQAMTDGIHEPALPEALEAIAARDQRLPDWLLPKIFQYGVQHRDVRAPIAAVAGERGRWLAALNKSWAYAGQLAQFDTGAQSGVTERERDLWNTGSRAGRAALLHALRGRDPDAARALLETTWSSDGAEDRTAFVEALVVGLGPADEPFLEAALDDRSKGVRRAAADVLARLISSAFAARMSGRAQAILNWKKGFLLGRGSLEIALPEAPDAAALRDGIEPASPHRQIGERAWHLIQILGSVPPAVWIGYLGHNPADLIKAAIAQEFWEPTLLGWGMAAIRFDDIVWAQALWKFWIGRKDRASFPREMIPSPDVLSSVDEALFWWAMQVEPEPLHDAHAAFGVLARMPQPWSDNLARAVMESVRSRIAASSGTPTDKYRVWRLVGALRGYAYKVDPALASELTAAWPTDSPGWEQWKEVALGFEEVLEYRRELLKEISTQ